VFVSRPISAGLLLAAAILVILLALPVLRTKREEAFQEEA
jgi:putative tricarboxylic transport membrane protein